MQHEIKLWGRFDSEIDGPIENKGLSEEGIINLLSEDDDEDDDKKSKDEDKDKDEEEDKRGDKDEDKDLKLDNDEDEEKDKEDKEDEKEDEDKDLEKELDLVAPHKKKDILKEFPTLFKKFPYLEQSYYGYQQYVEVFPTVDDAKEAQDAVSAFSKFEHSVMGGTTEDVLKAVKSNDKVFAKLVDDYLPALYRVDQGAAQHIVANVYKNAIAAMFKHAKDNKNEDVEKAATLIYQFLFPGVEWTPPSRLSKEDPKEVDKISEERREFQMEKFTTFQGELQGKVDNIVMSTIITNIDPKNSMSKFEKKHAANEAFQLAERAMLADKSFMAQMDRLWKAVIQNNYNRSAADNIRRTYLGKAKSVLKAAIKQARNEALGGKGRKKSSDDDEEVDRKGHLPVNRHSSGGNRDKEDKKESKKAGESTYDFFNR